MPSAGFEPTLADAGVLGKSVRLRKCPGGQFWDVWNVSASAIIERLTAARDRYRFTRGGQFSYGRRVAMKTIGHLDAVFLFSAVFNKT